MRSKQNLDVILRTFFLRYFQNLLLSLVYVMQVARDLNVEVHLS